MLTLVFGRERFLEVSVSPSLLSLSLEQTSHLSQHLLSLDSLVQLSVPVVGRCREKEKEEEEEGGEGRKREITVYPPLPRLSIRTAVSQLQ